MAELMQRPPTPTEHRSPTPRSPRDPRDPSRPRERSPAGPRSMPPYGVTKPLPIVFGGARSHSAGGSPRSPDDARLEEDGDGETQAQADRRERMARDIALARGGGDGYAAAMDHGSGLTKVQSNELIAENAVLKARLRATLADLRETRSLVDRQRDCEPRGLGSAHPSARGGSRIVLVDATSDQCEAATQTDVAPRSKSPPVTRKAPARRVETAAAATAMSGDDVLALLLAPGAMAADPATRSQQEHAMQQRQAQLAHDAQLRALKTEALRSHAECASLRQAVQTLRRAVGTSVAQGDAAQSDADDAVASAREAHHAAMDRVAAMADALEAAHAAVGKAERAAAQAQDELDQERLKAGARDAEPAAAAPQDRRRSVSEQRVDSFSGEGQGHVLALERALGTARAAAAAAEEEATALREELQQRGRTPRTPRGGAARAVVLTAGAGVQAQLDDPFIATLRTAGIDTASRDAAEEVLRAVTAAAELRASEAEARAAATAAATTATAQAEQQRSLEDARRELIAAHAQIEELQFAVELERRERFNPQRVLHEYRHGGAQGDGAAADLAAVSEKQQADAQKEVAFLCDVVAASKEEAERLRARCGAAEAARDEAQQQLAKVKAQSQALLAGCREVTETARQEAESSIAQAASGARQKDSEIFRLRGELTAAQREHRAQRQERDATAAALSAAKQKAVDCALAASTAKEQCNRQTVAARELRAHVAHLNALLAQAGLQPTPARGLRSAGSSVPTHEAFDPTSPLRRSMSPESGLQQLQRALDARDDAVGSKPRTYHDPSAAPEDEAAATDGEGERGVSEAEAAAVAAELEAARARVRHLEDVCRRQKQRLRDLEDAHRKLAPLTPEATTPFDVARGVAAGLAKQQETIAALQQSLKKTTVGMQVARKNAEAAKERAVAAEQEAAKAKALEAQVAAQVRDARRTHSSHRSVERVAERQGAAVDSRVVQLEGQLAAARAELLEAREELLEGRRVMFDLIGDDDDVLLSVARTHSADHGDEHGDAAASEHRALSTATPLSKVSKPVPGDSPAPVAPHGSVHANNASFSARSTASGHHRRAPAQGSLPPRRQPSALRQRPHGAGSTGRGQSLQLPHTSSTLSGALLRSQSSGVAVSESTVGQPRHAHPIPTGPLIS